MITEEKINGIYEKIIDNGKVTTKELKELGFTSNELTNLVKDNFLKRITRGVYCIENISNLYLYGKQLILKKEHVQAIKCFKMCYQIEPNYTPAAFQLFWYYINRCNYDKALIYFEIMNYSDNEFYQCDYRLYLFLLSMIIELPEKYIDKCNKLSFNDIKVSKYDKRYKDILIQNKIRYQIYKHKFVYALKLLNESITHEGNSIQLLLLRKLLQAALNLQDQHKSNILFFIKEKKYENLVTHLEEQKKMHRLSSLDEYSLIVAYEILNVINKGYINEIVNTNAYDVFSAIDNKDYCLALQLSKDYNERMNIRGNNNSLYLLLSDLNKLINNKKTVLSDIEKDTLNKEEDFEFDKQSNLSLISKDNLTHIDIIRALVMGNIEQALDNLNDWLIIVDKREYNFLIASLIKLSLVVKDITFTKPLNVLILLSRNSYQFDIMDYLKCFYESLRQNKYDEARIYLDIISKGDRLGQPCLFINALEDILNKTTEMVNCENIGLDNVNLEPINRPEMSNIVSQDEQKVMIDKSINSKNIEDKLKKLIEEKVQTLRESKGIVLLKPMDIVNRKLIHDIISQYPDITSFSIGNEPKRQIVLKYTTYVKGLNAKKVLKAAHKAYCKGEYQESIELNKQLLNTASPQCFVYARLGLAYLKLCRKNTAIDYLKVATDISLRTNDEFDFTELLMKLTGKMDASLEDRKVYVKMQASEFYNDLDNYYGIKCIEDITAALSNGISFDEVCNLFNLSEEEKALVLLIFAKECFAQNFDDFGEAYLKKVENLPNKSNKVRKIFLEIQKNKKFYKGRIGEEHKLLVLMPPK